MKKIIFKSVFILSIFLTFCVSIVNAQTPPTATWGVVNLTWHAGQNGEDPYYDIDPYAFVIEGSFRMACGQEYTAQNYMDWGEGFNGSDTKWYTSIVLYNGFIRITPMNPDNVASTHTINYRVRDAEYIDDPDHPNDHISNTSGITVNIAQYQGFQTKK